MVGGRPLASTPAAIRARTPAVSASAPVAPQPPAPVAPQAGTVTTGRVQQWLLNPNGEADGLLLADGTQVAFPPHLSAAVTQWLKRGDTVQVTGWRTPNLPVLRMQSLSANGRNLVDQPPTPGAAPPPRGPEALTALTAGGRIDRLLYNDRGDVHGVLLADKTIVRFPPHVGLAYAPQLQPNATLYARGWGTRGALGTALEATHLGSSADTLREVLNGPAGPAGPCGPAGPWGPSAVSTTRIHGESGGETLAPSDATYAAPLNVTTSPGL